ncbi:zinc finger CCCH domain-containing protein 7 [Phtheirospermum japonicum]|uniref:Zinc finger CCCH domain-containing protein 7 n=1 Tax=Phtheirospermum japonicum TaxID=374723 RepID=A0A830D396_9LAMI|nr:zinc finger CCCH domain-containing protein 7 [Phtheirospermum japonicum]
MKRHRLMDLQPPPPPIFRHQYQHHHHLRYEHVLLHPPNFIPQRTHNHFPPPPPPQLRQPHILLLPPPPLHIAHPPRFNLSPLPNLYPNRNFLPPPPPGNIDRQFHRGDNNRGRDNGINNCGRGLTDERDYGEKKCDRVMKKMDYDETRRGSIDGWIRGLYKDKDKDRGYDERRRGSGISEGQFVRSKKKRRLQKEETAMSRVHSGKDYFSRGKGGDEELSGGSFFRGKEKEGFESLQTRTDNKRASEAILAPPCPDDIKTEINSAIVEIGITSSVPGSPTMAKSSEDVVKAVVSESGIVADDANGSGEIDVKDQSQKDMKLQQGPTVVEPGSTCRSRLRRDRKARKKLLRGAGTQMGKDSDGGVANADDSIIIPPASPPQPCSDTNIVDLVEIAVENQHQKDMNLRNSPIVRASQSARRKKWKARKKLLQETNLLMRNDSCHIANANNDCSLGFYQHGVDVDKVVPKEVDAEKSKIESVDQYAKLGTDRLDDISVHSLHNGSPLEDSFLNGPSKIMVSLEGNDIVGSSQEDRCSSVIHASSESDSALLLKLENVNISDVGSEDSNSKEVFLNELNTPQVVVHSEEFTSLASVTVLDYASIISTSTDILAVDHKGVVDIFPPNDLSKKPSIGDIGSVEGSLEAISNGKTFLSVDNSSNFNGKRKAPGEVERVLAKDLVPAMEVDFLGEKSSSKEVDESNGGLSRFEDPTLELDFDVNGLYPSYSKKRKVVSPRSNLSSFSEDEMIADGLNGDCPKLCQVSTGPAEWEAEKRVDSSISRNTEASACQSENVMICGGENISNRKPVSPDLNLVPSDKYNLQINAKLSRSLPKANSEVVKKLNLVQGKQTLSKSQLISASPKVFPSHHPSYFGNSRKPQSAHAVKSRTWRRTGNSSVAVAETKSPPSSLPQSHGTKTAQTFRSSYIRKGNSLVRNPSLSAVTSGSHNSSGSVYRLNLGTCNLKINQASDCKTGDADAIKTSETPCKTMLASEERIKSPVVSECRADSGNIATSQSTLEEGNSEKKIIYVKRRSNQLVAASNSDDVTVLGADRSLASSSDGYYKSNKNQLVRASSENPVKKRVANGNSRRLVPRTILPRTCTKRPSKFSFVWKLHDMQSSEKHKTSGRPQKVLPHVVPWKRTTYWRSFMHALSTKPNKSSFSIASQTLLLSRKRGAIYTRSTHGYSLKMSKVLSVGGSSLKWSKSIERNLKKADEETTQAVAAAGERKKEENGAVKSRNNVSRKLVLSIKLHPGERIFRIGSERYKMDPSRRTLHRITAEQEPPSSVVVQSEKNVKRSYVPRRLLIGNEEYVRIGNGNQLVRDPKKRTRVLASEKVRWSLRTARLRLARKRKYCQFFTRFGKCNKDDGKCPYIHDLSKIAVCTKFLNGLCTNVDCKLTHKVIPERMEDCSYFLKGSCSNEKCPYRHVNVNSESGVCKNFLRGYCADGNECLKKHTYVCPTFEATGSCPKASTCKLHHPKKKIEKKQPAIEQKIVKGRYFDGGLIGDADVSDTSTEVVSAKGNDDVVSHAGKFPDYISLDVSDEEDSDDMDDMVSDDFDVLV